jgi:hypothetical protein
VPFKSEAQRRWMHANHPEMAKRWEAETPDKTLPNKVEKVKDTIGKIMKVRK